ncbi:hypothetical protein DM02DRAFT_657251 [Periconia macrospinosa]|uniref:Dystroglycan-type cadherin-like domain-containing protein n=1 Tax=Periconia macrospinosa TaxID=97972 RepID=A0A2V1DL31_9PLEO|nr:hypothetical protein DM02DRAFT_657251 [Periconia macrospinosa]
MARICHLVTGLAAIATLASVVASSPQVNYPLNLQLPPVARVGEQYRFQFASTTFQPNPDQLQYSLVGNPSWLHLNSSNRTLWGTPESNDVGTATFSITAAGEAGAVANMESKLLVVEDGPAMIGNISQQLSKSGQLTGPNSLTLLPSQPFEIRFDKEIFDSKGRDLSYYATSADHTPLPAWVSFNAQSLSFSGTTPFSPSPQSCNVLLIASSTPDFAETSAAFTIVGSSHQLLFRPQSQTLNVSKGQKVQIANLKQKLFLYNAPIMDADIQSAKAEIPPWLSFDNHSFEITGVPPGGLMAQDLSITVIDKYGDSARHDIHVSFISKLFTAGIEQLNITAGQPFEYTIPRSILAQEGENVFLNMRGLEQWLKFDPDTLTIRGTIPDEAVPRETDISMTATTSDGASQDSQTIPVRILEHSGAAGSKDDSNGLGSQITDGALNTHARSSNRKRAGIIAGSVISAIVATMILVAIIRCLHRRKKKYAKGYISPRAPRSPRKSDISRPLPPIVEEWGKVDIAHDADLEKGKDEEDPPKRTPEPPPRLDLNLPSKQSKHHSATSSLDEPGDRIFSDFSSSPYGLQDEAGPSRCPHDSMRTPTKILRTESELSPHKERERSSLIYRDTACHSPTPSVKRRQRSIRHVPTGHTYSSSGGTNLTSRHRRSVKSSSSATNTLSMASTVATAIPQPHRARHTTQLTTPLDKRPSIRSVVPETSTVRTLPSQSSTSEKRISWTERRKTYFKDRASSQKNVSFFGGGATRVASGSYSKPPAFLTQHNTPVTETALQPISDNVVKLSDDPASDIATPVDLPDTVKIRRPFETPSPRSESGKFSGTLRKKRSSLIRRHTEELASKEQYLRQSPERERHTSVVHLPQVPNPRARGLKSGLNESTQEQIYEDSEMSVSEYSDEETTIQSYDNRSTITQADFVVRPLNPNKKRNKQNSNTNTRKELKRTSEREATPYFTAPFEHGGKENDSPYHDGTPKQTTSGRESPARYSGSVTTTRIRDSITQSPSPSPTRRRPKTSTGLRTSTRIVRMSSNASSPRARRRPLSQTHAVRASSPRSHRPTSQDRNSRSSTIKTTTHYPSPSLTRSQSSAFPHFAAKKRSSRQTHRHTHTTTTESHPETQDPTTHPRHRSRRSQSTQLEDLPHDRDISGNLILLPSPSPPPPSLPEKNPRRPTTTFTLTPTQTKIPTKRRSHNPQAATATSSHPFYQANRRGAGVRSLFHHYHHHNQQPIPPSSSSSPPPPSSSPPPPSKLSPFPPTTTTTTTTTTHRDPPHAPLPVPPLSLRNNNKKKERDSNDARESWFRGIDLGLGCSSGEGEGVGLGLGGVMAGRERDRRRSFVGGGDGYYEDGGGGGGSGAGGSGGGGTGFWGEGEKAFM